MLWRWMFDILHSIFELLRCRIHSSMSNQLNKENWMELEWNDMCIDMLFNCRNGLSNLTVFGYCVESVSKRIFYEKYLEVYPTLKSGDLRNCLHFKKRRKPFSLGQKRVELFASTPKPARSNEKMYISVHFVAVGEDLKIENVITVSVINAFQTRLNGRQSRLSGRQAGSSIMFVCFVSIVAKFRNSIM